MSDSISETGKGPATPKERVEAQIKLGIQALENFANSSYINVHNINRHLLSVYHEVVLETTAELSLFREWELHIKEGTLTEELNQNIMDRLTSFRNMLDEKRKERIAAALVKKQEEAGTTTS